MICWVGRLLVVVLRVSFRVPSWQVGGSRTRTTFFDFHQGAAVFSERFCEACIDEGLMKAYAFCI